MKNFETATIAFYKGVAAKKSEGLEASIKHYDRAIELKPDLTEAYITRGIALAELGRYEEAIADFDLAIELKPAAIVYTNRAIAQKALVAATKRL